MMKTIDLIKADIAALAKKHPHPSIKVDSVERLNSGLSNESKEDGFLRMSSMRTIKVNARKRRATVAASSPNDLLKKLAETRKDKMNESHGSIQAALNLAKQGSKVTEAP